MPKEIGPTPQELRRALHEAADWAASYLETVEERPVLARVAPGEIASVLPQSALVRESLWRQFCRMSIA